MKIGQEINDISSHPSRIGMVIASGENRKDAELNASKAVNNISIRYK